MKKIVSTVVIILVVIVVVIAMNGENKNISETVKIGVILPLSERGATWGENVRDSFLLAHNELPEGKRNNFELIFEDDQLDPAKSVSAYTKLRDIDGVEAVVTVASGGTLAVGPLAEEDGIIMFALTNNPEATTDKNHVFRHFFLPNIDANKIKEEVVNRNHKKIAVFTTEQSGVLAIKDEFKKIIPEGVEIVIETDFESNTKDFRTEIAKAREVGADSFGLFMMPGQIGIMAKQIRDSGATEQIFSIGTIDDANEIAVGGQAMEGIWVSGPEGPLPWFNESFKKSYGRDAGLFAGNAYDVANILFGIFDKTRDQDELAKLASEVKDFDGSMGNGMVMDENNSIIIGAVIREIRGGKLVFLHD